MTEQALFEIECTEKPAFPAGFYKNRPRPTLQSDEVLAMVADKLMPSIEGWLMLDAEDDQHEMAVKEYADDLLLALEVSRDGYKMASYLDDRHGWDSDAELVDILEGADFYGCERIAVMAWVNDNDVKPKYETGAQVKIKIRRDPKEYTGEVTHIREDGTYTVCIEELGHIKQGIGTHGMVFKWEELEGWN